MRSNKPSSALKAFTLIELVLVVAIAGVLAAMAAPRYAAALNRYRADSAARRISADIALAQSRARTTSTSTTIVFDSSSSAYRLVGEKDLSVAANTYSVDLTANPYCATITRVSFGGNSTLGFNGYGVPSGAGSIVVSVGATTRAVSIDADSAVAKVQ